MEKSIIIKKKDTCMGRKGNKERKKDRSTEANKVMKEVRVPKGNKERRNYKGGRRLGEVKEIRT